MKMILTYNDDNWDEEEAKKGRRLSLFCLNQCQIKSFTYLSFIASTSTRAKNILIIIWRTMHGGALLVLLLGRGTHA